MKNSNIRKMMIEHEIVSATRQIQVALDSLTRAFSQFPDSVQFDRKDAIGGLRRSVLNVVEDAILDLEKVGA